MYPDPEERARQREDIESRIDALERLPHPTNVDEQIAELLQLSAEEGTGTILDMVGLSEHEDYFMVAPLTASELIDVFGTDKPDHQMIVAAGHSVMDLRSSQKGSYVIVYKNGEADEIYFAGFSGD
jgi:hypothetical protein